VLQERARALPAFSDRTRTANGQSSPAAATLALMRPSFDLFVFLQERVAEQRLRVWVVVALALHLLPVLGLAGTPAHALQAVEALTDEILIQLESPASSAPPPGPDRATAGAGAPRPVQGEPVLPPIPHEREDEPEEPTQPEPETKVTPAGESAPSEVPPEPESGGIGPVLTLGSSEEGDGLFAGNGTGPLRAEICFIPETTRSLRQISECSPVYQEYLDRINIPPRSFSEGFPGFPERVEFFAVNIQGTFRVSQPGRYSFRLKSDDGAQLFIDDALVVDNDGMHEPLSRRGEAELSAGQHRIRVWYFQGVRYELALQLFVSAPGESERIFSSNL
jgi:hypothetical protein